MFATPRRAVRCSATPNCHDSCSPVNRGPVFDELRSVQLPPSTAGPPMPSSFNLQLARPERAPLHTRRASDRVAGPAPRSRRETHVDIELAPLSEFETQLAALSDLASELAPLERERAPAPRRADADGALRSVHVAPSTASPPMPSNFSLQRAHAEHAPLHTRRASDLVAGPSPAHSRRVTHVDIELAPLSDFETEPAYVGEQTSRSPHVS